MRTSNFVKTKYQDLLYLSALNGKSVYENEFNKLSNLPAVRKLTKNHITIQDIFRHSWDDFKLAVNKPIRSSIHKNVEAMINCRDLSKGHLFLECNKCNNFHIIGLSCGSRFCSSCGHKYRDQRSIEIKKKLLKVNHRHFVFSVPFDLRPLFWRCRELFDCLFLSVDEALHLSIKLSKKDRDADYRLGFVSFLHTSGRSLNRHPHLHVLLAEALVDKDGNTKSISFIPFDRLRMSFMYIFLRNASKILKKYGDKKLYREFNILRNKIVKQYKDGFYTYGPRSKDILSEDEKLDSVKKIADYIARYASHPPLSESNILDFDYDTSDVTWKYHDYETDKEVIIKEHSFSFISKLIPHILDKGFHQIRYYGFYSNRTNRIKDKQKLLSANYIKYLKSKLIWRIMLLETYRYDIKLCSCGGKMFVNYEMSLLPKKERKCLEDG